ncbi:MAG: bifunctional metallophosphatase/5'-nucleotidase [Luteitalea sp.]
MRRGLLLLCLTAACAPTSRPAEPTAPPASFTTISVVATTDLHGRVQALSWLSGHLQILRELRRADRGGVLLVDAGDMWQGTLESNLSEGQAVVRAYNTLGYDAVAIGNHEFDFGPVGPSTVPRTDADNPTGVIEARAREARFPFLAANLRTRDGRAWTPPNIRPSTVVTVAGVEIGLIGVTTTTTPGATDPRNLVRLQVRPLLETIVPEAERLRQQGATAIVVLAHAGGRCNTFVDPDDLGNCTAQSEVFQLARALPPGLVDVIAAGHSHQAIAHRVNGVVIVQAFNEGRAFSRADLIVDTRSGRVRTVHISPPQLVCNGRTSQDIDSWAADTCRPAPYESRTVRYDDRVATALRADIARAQARREQLLGVTVTTRYWHSSREESPASNLVVDLLRAATPGADVAVYNASGTRADLRPGPVTYGDMYELVPFDSVTATASLTAGTLADALARGLGRGTAPMLSGLEATARCEAGTVRVVLLREGRPMPPETRLSVVTTEFLASGGAGVFEQMQDAFTLQLDRPMREVIIGAVPREAARIVSGLVGGYDTARPRLRLPGPLPLRCP